MGILRQRHAGRDTAGFLVVELNHLTVAEAVDDGRRQNSAVHERVFERREHLLVEGPEERYLLVADHFESRQRGVSSSWGSSEVQANLDLRIGEHPHD